MGGESGGVAVDGLQRLRGRGQQLEVVMVERSVISRNIITSLLANFKRVNGRFVPGNSFRNLVHGIFVSGNLSCVDNAQ